MVTTAGGIEEDLIKCLAPTFLGDFTLKGRDLRLKGINRTGNLLVPNDNYCKFETWLTPILDQMLEEQKTKVFGLIGIDILYSSKTNKTLFFLLYQINEQHLLISIRSSNTLSIKRKPRVYSALCIVYNLGTSSFPSRTPFSLPPSLPSSLPPLIPPSLSFLSL